jgi:DNA-nicking Smr family endonuclease
MPRRLAPDEQALWAKVVQNVRPLHSFRTAEPPAEVAPAIEAKPIQKVAKPRPVSARPAVSAPSAKAVPGTTLDAGWDRRLSRGAVAPDMTIDLHDHDLSGAYALLDTRLEQAIGMGARLVLLITGRPPKGEPPILRGRIRHAVGDWLHASRHAGNIAAVRGAHPRHGGAGALYIVLRRKRS